MIDLKDKILKCVECKNDFVFTVNEQEFYLKKAFFEPRRCYKCRKLRKKDKSKKRKNLLKSLKIQ